MTYISLKSPAPLPPPERLPAPTYIIARDAFFKTHSMKNYSLAF